MASIMLQIAKGALSKTLGLVSEDGTEWVSDIQEDDTHLTVTIRVTKAEALIWAVANLKDMAWVSRDVRMAKQCLDLGDD